MGLFLFQQAGRKQLIFFLTAAFYPGTQVTSLFCWSGTPEAYCRFLLFWAQMKQKIHMLLFVDALIFYSTGAELSLALYQEANLDVTRHLYFLILLRLCCSEYQKIRV